MDVLLWPNFVGSLDAPTTAKYFAEKNARAADSVVIFASVLVIPGHEFVIFLELKC